MEWDAGNSTKSQTKHGFRTADVESILDAALVFAGQIIEPAHDEPRYLLLGVTSGGRHAALVFTRRGDKLRPISCRAMRKKEKEAYDAATSEERPWRVHEECARQRRGAARVQGA